ncbi:MAG: hypothetical protein RLZZ292_3965 [Bacteroidota bacterium]|jgi:hypothetical protein
MYIGTDLDSIKLTFLVKKYILSINYLFILELLFIFVPLIMIIRDQPFYYALLF